MHLLLPLQLLSAYSRCLAFFLEKQSIMSEYITPANQTMHFDMSFVEEYEFCTYRGKP